jgi:predicted RNase H-like HicB family nuclease
VDILITDDGVIFISDGKAGVVYRVVYEKIKGAAPTGSGELLRVEQRWHCSAPQVIFKLQAWGESRVKLKVILEPSDEGGFTVSVPSLPGCISEGNTMKEAIQNIREAIDLYLEEEPPVLPEKAQVLELVV